MKKVLGILSLMLLLAAAPVAFAADGAAIYKVCAGCHGADGSKTTGGSTPVKGQTADALFTKLKGYAAGTYGGEGKKVMENGAKKLSDADMKAVSDYMGKL